MSLNLKPQYSFYGGESPRESLQSESSWKSDVNINSKWSYSKHSSNETYYKNYEHDEIPVKDDSNRFTKEHIATSNSYNNQRKSLTNSDLDRLENKIYKNMSEELQTDESKVCSLESNIKFFKTTVQELFETFYANMQDFEVYKKRFEEILAKNKEDSLADMEDFIKDMIHHILSTDSCISNENRNGIEMSPIDTKDSVTVKAVEHVSSNTLPERQTAKLLESLHSVVEAYQNENYLTDSTFDDNSSRLTNQCKKEEKLNIYLLGGAPCVQIRMNDRNLLSEININNAMHEHKECHVASADNLTKLADKKMELEEYVKKPVDTKVSDREIPIKVSFAKKNICLNEDFINEKEKEENKSIMYKICNYICKKLRKN